MVAMGHIVSGVVNKAVTRVFNRYCASVYVGLPPLSRKIYRHALPTVNIFVTQADDSRVSKAFIRVCVCVCGSVYLSPR